MAGNILEELLVSILTVFDESSNKQAMDAVDKAQVAITDKEKKGGSTRNKNLVANLGSALKTVEGYTKSVLQFGEKVTLGLAAVAGSVEGAAVAGTFALARLSKEMGAAYYSGQKLSSAVKDMEAFKYASEMTGSSAAKAQAGLEELGHLKNTNPGAYIGLLQRLGVAATDAAGKIRAPAQAAMDLPAALARQSRPMQLMFGNQLGMDDDQTLAMVRPEFLARIEQYQEMQRKIGFDPDKAAADGARFQQIWTKMWTAVDLVSKKVQAAFFNQVGGSVDHVTDWLVKNAGRISDLAIKVGTFVIHLATSIADLATQFDRLDPATQRFVEILGGLAVAFLALRAGPIGAILTLATALATLWDDYEKYRQGLPHVVDWEKWEPKIKATIDGLTALWKKFDELALKITGQGGLQVAFEAFATFLAVSWTARVLGAFQAISGGWLAMLARMGFANPAAFIALLTLGAGGVAGAMNSPHTDDYGRDAGTWGGDGSDKGALGAHLRHRKAHTPDGIGKRLWNWGKDKLGLGGGDAFNPQAPVKPGTYRPEYKISATDTDDDVVNTIAGEAVTSNSESIDAVVNNMMNRLGTKGWGPSGNLHEVARAPGQYSGYRPATPQEAERIRERIKAIASGGVPDNTNGANSYRAAGYRGPWAWKHAADGRVVGGNRFAFEASVPNGPYAPYPASAMAPSPQGTSNKAVVDAETFAARQRLSAGGKADKRDEYPDWMDERSKRELAAVNAPLARDLIAAAEATGQRFTVAQGMRDQAEADANARSGRGVTNSQHLYGAAADIHLLDQNGHTTYDRAAYQKFAEAFEKHSRDTGGNSRWLGNASGRWASDIVHFDQGLGYGQSHARDPYGTGGPTKEDVATGNRLAYAAPGNPFLSALGVGGAQAAERRAGLVAPEPPAPAPAPAGDAAHPVEQRTIGYYLRAARGALAKGSLPMPHVPSAELHKFDTSPQPTTAAYGQPIKVDVTDRSAERIGAFGSLANAKAWDVIKKATAATTASPPLRLAHPLMAAAGVSSSTTIHHNTPTVHQDIDIHGIQNPNDIASHMKIHARRGVQDGIRTMTGPSQ